VRVDPVGDFDAATELDDRLLSRARARVGTVLRSKYRLDRVLGVGGMASVYAATHLRNANRVAVKIIHRELAVDADLRARFLREGYAANSVEHRGTVRILDDDTTEDGAVYLVMELLDGETLDARWERGGRKLGVREVAALISELLVVLAAAHAKGIVHRDIKPENLFLTKAGEVKVLDFGIARLREASPTRTRTGAVYGTPAFMPPEQALGRMREVDALSDVWAVGATAFTLLSGRFVHTGETAEEMLVHAATRPAPPLASVAAHVPPLVAEVIDRALAFDKADRWQSARAMQEALERVRGDANRTPVSADDWDAETRLAPPPQMTERGDDAPALESAPSETTVALPTLHAVSTVAGVESLSEARRVRRERRLIGAGAGGLLLVVAVGIVVALATGSRHSVPNGPATASASPSGGAVGPASIPAAASFSAVASAVAPPVMPVEALPLAPPATPPRSFPTAAPPVAPIATAARTMTTTAPTSMRSAPPLPSPTPTTKRDPLAP
jgi:eukaryotic-like serine/threonine-protein kinase